MQDGTGGLVAAAASRELPYTGDPQVEEVLARLGELCGAEVAEQLPVYEAVQRGLHDCLSDAGPGRPD
jgi:hypothetical protein